MRSTRCARESRWTYGHERCSTGPKRLAGEQARRIDARGASAPQRRAARGSPGSRAWSGSERSRMFQISASEPPGRSTRWISRNGGRDAEPVERLARRSRRRRSVRERDRLGGAVERVDVGERREQLLAHLVDRLDGDHAGRRKGRARGSACRCRRRGRARSRPGSSREALDDPRDRLVGIARPAALVRVRGSRETLRGRGWISLTG